MPAKLPYMRMWWDDFFGDSRVRWLTTEQKGVYLLLLGLMWQNEGWLSADDKIIARQLGMDVRRWRSRYADAILPMMSSISDPICGQILVQKRLRTEFEKAAGALDNLQRGAARSRAKKAAKSSAAARKPEPAKSAATKPDNQPAQPAQEAALQSKTILSTAQKEKGSALQAESPSHGEPSQDFALPPREPVAAVKALPVSPDDELAAVRSDLTKRLVADGLKRPSLSDIANLGRKS